MSLLSKLIRSHLVWFCICLKDVWAVLCDGCCVFFHAGNACPYGLTSAVSEIKGMLMNWIELRRKWTDLRWMPDLEAWSDWKWLEAMAIVQPVPRLPNDAKEALTCWDCSLGAVSFSKAGLKLQQKPSVKALLFYFQATHDIMNVFNLSHTCIIMYLHCAFGCSSSKR